MNWLLSKVLIACLKQCIEQMFPATVYFGLSPVCFLRGVRASVAEYSPDCREFALS